MSGRQNIRTGLTLRGTRLFQFHHLKSLILLLFSVQKRGSNIEVGHNVTPNLGFVKLLCLQHLYLNGGQAKMIRIGYTNYVMFLKFISFSIFLLDQKTALVRIGPTANQRSLAVSAAQKTGHPSDFDHGVGFH